jgi:DNA helicase HerA-like ATPase
MWALESLSREIEKGELYMIKDSKVLLGKSGEEEIFIYPRMANRHGMIAGATGTGKTVTLKVMAESFSKLGVPVFLADVKGDLVPLVKCGEENENVSSRVEKMGLKEAGFAFDSFPVNIWDVYGEKGMPLRTTISEIGPLLLARIMGLNDTQTDILHIVFKIADDEGLLLIDTKDLKAMIQYVGDNKEKYSQAYGNIAAASLNAITRGIVTLEGEGADKFFGEPALSIADFLCTDNRGRGMIQLLDCQKLILKPKMYSTFLLWLMSELFENLPEVGDCDRPKMVFFFDEAHMLFDSASKDLLEKIEQVVKLIRSKGVGIYFITQNPKDIPDGILAQLGNKVQHALRAYTPAEQKGVKAAAQSFRENPEFDTYTVLQELSTGEALVSVLDETGVPTIVKRVKICPPESYMGTIDDSLRTQTINNSLLYSRYSNFVDRDSAYEFLDRMNTQIQENARKEEEQLNETQKRMKEIEARKKATTKAVKSVASTTAGTIGRQVGKSLGGAVGGSFGKTLGGNVGASLGRGLLSTLFGGK